MTVLEDLRYGLFGKPVAITVDDGVDESGQIILVQLGVISPLEIAIVAILIVLFLVFMWFLISPLFLNKRRRPDGTLDPETGGSLDEPERTGRLASWLHSSEKKWNSSSSSLSTNSGLGFNRSLSCGARPSMSRNPSDSSFGTPPSAFGMNLTPPPPAYASPRPKATSPANIEQPTAVVPVEGTSRVTIIDEPTRPRRSPSRSVESQAGRVRRPSPPHSPRQVSPVLPSPLGLSTTESGLARIAPTPRKVSDSTLHANEHVPSRAVMVIHHPVAPSSTAIEYDGELDGTSSAKQATSLTRMLETGGTDMDAEKTRFHATSRGATRPPPLVGGRF